MIKNQLSYVEVSLLTGIDQDEIVVWVEREWVTPAQSAEFDAEDIARLRLIKDLIYDFGANEEAIPLILHLIDQLNHLQNEVRRGLGKIGAHA